MNSRLALVFGIIFVVMASAATSQKTSANYPWLMVFLSKFSDRKDGVGPARLRCLLWMEELHMSGFFAEWTPGWMVCQDVLYLL
jgi:hypothetical protein